MFVKTQKHEKETAILDVIGDAQRRSCSETFWRPFFLIIIIIIIMLFARRTKHWTPLERLSDRTRQLGLWCPSGGPKRTSWTPLWKVKVSDWCSTDNHKSNQSNSSTPLCSFVPSLSCDIWCTVGVPCCSHLHRLVALQLSFCESGNSRHLQVLKFSERQLARCPVEPNLFVETSQIRSLGTPSLLPVRLSTMALANPSLALAGAFVHSLGL